MRYEERQVRKILHPTGGFLSSFTHSLNTYAGCAFGRQTTGGAGCPYCYVRELPVAKFAEARWGDWVVGKVNAAECLDRELDFLRTNGAISSLRVFMGTSTDVYQGVETKLGITRQVLQVFSRYPEISALVVQTRSPLIERDLDLLQGMARRLWVSFTVETNDEQVRRALTPTSPSIERRWRTLEKLVKAGIRTQAAISPMLPNQPEAFARSLQSRCSRALVDTFWDGDGSGGRRTEALGMEALYARLGYSDWWSRDRHLELITVLKESLGPHRVVFSQEGFNAV